MSVSSTAVIQSSSNADGYAHQLTTPAMQRRLEQLHQPVPYQSFPHPDGSANVQYRRVAFDNLVKPKSWWHQIHQAKPKNSNQPQDQQHAPNTAHQLSEKHVLG